MTIDLRCGRWQAFVDSSAGPDACWPWTGAKNRAGYGNLRVGSTKDGSRKTVSAHRLAHELFIGPIAPGDVVRHRCDNPSCVNPAHLVCGSQSDNVRDCVERGRHRPGRGGPRPIYGERNGRAKITREMAADIRARVASGESKRSVARTHGVSDVQVGRIAAEVNWR